MPASVMNQVVTLKIVVRINYIARKGIEMNALHHPLWGQEAWKGVRVSVVCLETCQAFHHRTLTQLSPTEGRLEVEAQADLLGLDYS